MKTLRSTTHLEHTKLPKLISTSAVSLTISLLLAHVALADARPNRPDSAKLAQLTSSSPSTATRSAVTTLDLPAQPLSTALHTIADRLNTNILFDPEQVKNIQAPAFKGSVTIEQALSVLLAGTKLRYEFMDERTISLMPAGAKTTSNLTKPTFSSSIHLAQNQSSEAAQQTGPTSEANTAEGTKESAEEVVVTGSRLKHRDATGPSPVITITREDIDRSGAATVREVLNRITQSAATMDESGNATFLGASTIQLRGLPVGTTLMLLNGRRLGASGAQASSNFFDLNSIPLEAVERIEILTDSASAIYGADAIGGAVNLILKRDFSGAGASARLGTSGNSDATERSGSVTFGGRRNSFSGLVLFDYFDRDPLHGTDRNLTSSDDFTRFGGADFRSTFSYPANIYSLDGNPLPGLTSTFAGVPTGTDGIGLTPADFQATDGVLNLFDGARYSTLLAEAKRKSVFASGRYALSPRLSLFGEVLYTDREQTTGLAPDALPFGQFGFFKVPANNPFNPFGVDVGVDYRFVEMGPRANEATTKFSRWVIGATGALFERFDWELYALGDHDTTDVFNRGSVNSFLNIDLVQHYLDLTDPNVALNVFSTTGNNNPQTLAEILAATETTDDLSTGARMAEMVVRGPLFDLPAGPLSAVLGVNGRRERVDFLSPLAGDIRDDRHSDATFVELSIPLVSAAQSIPAVHSMELTAALRHDHYEEFDSSTNPQFGLTWRPTPSLLLRASYGEAFKAPTVFDLFFPQLTIPGAFAFDPLRGDEPSEFIATLGGNPSLAPENGRSTTIGTVWKPSFAPGLSASVNAFRVEQENFITSLDLDSLLHNEALFPGRIVRAAPDPTDPPGFAGRIISVDLSKINFGRLTVKGLDLQLEYAFAQTAHGRFVASLAGTYTDEYNILLTPGSAPTNRVNQANTSGYPMRLKGNAGLSWSSMGGWSASLAARYRNSYTDYDGVRELPSQTLFDVQLGRHFSDGNAGPLFKGLDATLGIINATDEQGDFSNSFAGYDPQQADMRGRFYYLNLKLRF